MKIEMGESLFYSWLRHVKACQVVQTNWKVSQQWELKHSDELEELMKAVDEHFKSKYDYSVFKGNTSVFQLLQQGECDAVGLNISTDGIKTYGIDVAFHEAGLNYGDRKTTVMKVVEKCARTAMCFYGYLGARDSEIIFASPKINNAVIADLEPCITDLNDIFSEHGFDFIFCIIANDEYNAQVLQPILRASNGISDTSELFLRSYQMFMMFSDGKEPKPFKSIGTSDSNPLQTPRRSGHAIEDEYVESQAYCELKVGQLAQRVLGRMLRDGCATADEIEQMQTASYSKQNFDLQFPLLVRAGSQFNTARYYSKPLYIRNEQYYLCSQWFEVSANNDRPYLLKWIALHSK